MKGLPDAYDLRARIAPLVLTLAPVLALIIGSALRGSRSAIGGSLLLAAGLTLLAQLGRDRGRALQAPLWRKWGGAPTVQKLRADPSSVSTTRRRESVERALGITLPTASEQRVDAAAADERLHDAGRQLAARATHDSAPQVWQENVNYGFRRNLLGLRPFGLAVASTVIVLCLLAAVITEHPTDRLIAFAVPISTSLVALAVLVVVVTEAWVRVPADAYAERLLDGVPLFVTEPAPGGDGGHRQQT